MIEEVQVPVRSRLWTDQDAAQAYALLTEGKAAKYGTYSEEDGEQKARTQGMSLDRLIEANHGRRFGVSVWTDQEGNIIGALVPREPHKNRGRKAGSKNSK